MWKVIFTKKLFDELNEFLFQTTNENGCFLLGNSFTTKKGKNTVLIISIIKPNKNSWNYNTEHSLAPNSSFINHAVSLAEEQNSNLIFVHTHPHSLHPPTFSYIDKKTNREIFENLSEILDKPLGSLVFSSRGICGVMYKEGKIMPVSRITISGHILSEYPGIGFESKTIIKKKFDRQNNAIGEPQQNLLQQMTVSIIGSGGTGSAAAVQLARMGIKRLQLFDYDIITETNVPRVYGSKDSDCGKPKVQVLKDHIESFSNTKVDAYQVDITKADVLAELLDSNAIFACTDNLTSRSQLNDISINYSIPLIDIGCRIDLNDNKTIDQAIVKVQVVTPDDACLWCTEALNAKIILQESLSEQEKQSLAKEGYYESIENQPSIITLTTRAASMGVDKLLSLIGVFGNEYNSRTQIELKDGIMIEDTPKIKKQCICRKQKLPTKIEVINYP